MGKKTYHIVDPGTGAVVEEKDYGLFSRFLFWSASTKGKITLWVALGAIVLLCLTLSALAPSLPGVPASVLSVARDIPFCVAILVPLRFALRFVAGLGRKKPEPEPEQEYYHIVDPDTGAVVDRMVVSHAAPQKSRLAFALYKVYKLCTFFAFVFGVGIFLVPHERKFLVALLFFCSFLLSYVIAIICIHIP